MSNVPQLFKRWVNIALGRSTVAVEQCAGKCFSKEKIGGYYNDLTGKISEATLLDDVGIPINKTSTGDTVYSLVTIMQYALGCYDLYLINSQEKYRTKFLQLAEFILDEQDASGKWDARASIGSTKGNSSCMAQGQGCSILVRAYGLNHDRGYAAGAERAINFMLMPTDKGGTAIYSENRITFEKYPPQSGKVSSVLNGWIFALYGLYDYILFTDSEKHRKIFELSCKTLEDTLPMYDRKYWSNYDLIGTIASPAYHSVHVSLLTVLSNLCGSSVMGEYATRFAKYSKSPVKKYKAIIVKLIQKVSHPNDAFFVQ